MEGDPDGAAFSSPRCLPGWVPAAGFEPLSSTCFTVALTVLSHVCPAVLMASTAKRWLPPDKLIEGLRCLFEVAVCFFTPSTRISVRAMVGDGRLPPAVVWVPHCGPGRAPRRSANLAFESAVRRLALSPLNELVDLGRASGQG
jgi:hypothetical protein